MYPNASFVAIDPSPQVNKLKGSDRIRAYQGIVQNMDFSDQKFDVIMIFGNLMLHIDPFDTLKIATELLADDGLLLFDFKNINSSSRKIARVLGHLGIASLNKKTFIQRNFVNMRYGLSKKYMNKFCNGLGLSVTREYSKPPRLLEFGNKSNHTKGVSGSVWRLLNAVDKVNDEMAWIQFSCVKK